jgi:flagellar biosynthesis/type III secretory pathway protein FliH
LRSSNVLGFGEKMIKQMDKEDFNEGYQKGFKDGIEKRDKMIEEKIKRISETMKLINNLWMEI